MKLSTTVVQPKALWFTIVTVAMIAKFLIYLSGNIYFQHSQLFFSSQHVCCSPSFKDLSSIRKESVILFGPKYLIFYFNNIRFFIQKKRCFLKIAVPEFQKYKKMQLSNSAKFWKYLQRIPFLVKLEIYSLQLYQNMSFLTVIFQGFCLFFRNT